MASNDSKDLKTSVKKDTAEKVTTKIDVDSAKAFEGENHRGDNSNRGGRRGRGYWRGRGRGRGVRNSKGSSRTSKGNYNAEALSVEALMAKQDKPVIYDLSTKIDEPKIEIEKFLTKFSPEKIRRSDGVGWIYVLSETATKEDKKEIFETNGETVALREEWERMTEKENIEINFQTINSLSEKFNIKGGKWLMHYIGEYVEIIWKRIVLELVYKKFPDGVIGLKISPVNDINVPGASSQGGLKAHEHVICILHRDMTNVKEIHEIEKVVRNISIKCELLYKPNIFSTIGIYRENKYKLRPTIYASNRKETDDFVVKCVIDENWTYQKTPKELNNNTDENQLILIAFLKDRLHDMRKSLNTFDSARIQLDKKIQLLKEEIKGNASNNNSTPTEISKKE